MKTLKLFLLLAFLLPLTSLFAQDKEKSAYQGFMIHEDIVHPYMVNEYEAAAKTLKDALVKYNVQGADHMTMQAEGFRYLYVSPVENMAELDNNPFAVLKEKMPKEEHDAMWKAFDPCYNSHGNYMMVLNKELTYMPEGITNNPEGQPYRNIDYWYVTPSNWEALMEQAKKYKALAKEKGSKAYYRIYSSGMGMMGPIMIVASSGKDRADWEAIGEAANEAMGEERKAIIGDALKLAYKIESFEGWVRSDLSYKAKTETAETLSVDGDEKNKEKEK